VPRRGARDVVCILFPAYGVAASPVAPGELLRAIQRALRPDGTLVIDRDAHDRKILSEIHSRDQLTPGQLPPTLVVAMLEGPELRIEAIRDRSPDLGRHRIPGVLDRISFDADDARGDAATRAHIGS
jgi:hypothetical protein